MSPWYTFGAGTPMVLRTNHTTSDDGNQFLIGSFIASSDVWMRFTWRHDLMSGTVYSGGFLMALFTSDLYGDTTYWDQGYTGEGGMVDGVEYTAPAIYVAWGDGNYSDPYYRFHVGSGYGYNSYDAPGYSGASYSSDNSYGSIIDLHASHVADYSNTTDYGAYYSRWHIDLFVDGTQKINYETDVVTNDNTHLMSNLGAVERSDAKGWGIDYYHDNIMVGTSQGASDLWGPAGFDDSTYNPFDTTWIGTDSFDIVSG